jgi:hypothetical protein
VCWSRSSCETVATVRCDFDRQGKLNIDRGEKKGAGASTVNVGSFVGSVAGRWMKLASKNCELLVV